MIKFRFNNKNYDIVGSFGFTKSSREVTFNDIDIDFTNYEISDLPIKYQECQVCEVNKVKDEEILITEKTSSSFIGDGHNINNFTLYGETEQNGTPTPSTPVEIDVVTGLQNVKIHTKNLFDKHGDFTYGNSNYKTNLNAQGQLVSTSNYWSKRSAGLLIENLEPNTDYTMSGILVSASGTNENNNANIDIRSGDDTKSIKVNIFATSLTKPYDFKFTFNTGNFTSIWISFNGNNNSGSGDTETIFDNIQLEKGTVATEYIEHQEQNYPINLGKNLFDENYENINSGLTYKSIYVGTGTFIMSTTTPKNTDGNANLFFLSGKVSSGASTGQNGVFENRPITKESTNGYVTVAYRNSGYVNPADYDTQIEKGSATSYSLYFTPIELCEIGDYQDKIYHDNGKWYLHKETRHLSLAIADMNNSESYPGWTGLAQLKKDYPSKNHPFNSLTTFMSNICNYGVSFGINTNGNGVLWLYTGVFNLTQSEWKEKFPNLAVDLYYGLQEPEIIEIIPENYPELYKQLNALSNAQTYVGENNITITTENLEPSYEIEYYLGTGKYTYKNIIVDNYFTGYVNNFKFDDMIREDDDKILSLELLSPMAMASKRSVSAIGTYDLKELINKLLQPLIVDGFELKELNIGNHTTAVNYLLETIETCLNRLSNKFSFWWYIDENKGIYINDINYKFNLSPTLIYDDDNNMPNLYKITPSIDATDYCNVINFTNVRLYNYSYYFTYEEQTGRGTRTLILEKQPLFNKDIVIKKGDTVEFKHPIDVNVANIIKSDNANKGDTVLKDISLVALEVKCKDSANNDKSFKVYTDGTNLLMSNNVEFDGEGTTDTTKDFSLIRDNFFSNLVTGFKYNGNNSITSVTNITSCSALMWTRLKILNAEEIEKCKMKINLSGQIEKIIDMNETWHVLSELKTIADSYFYINGTETDNVILKADNDKDINYNFEAGIGDVVKICKPNFYVDGKFIVTDIKTNFDARKKVFKDWQATLRNSNYLENYIDLFRASEEQQTNEKNYNYIVSNYVEDGLQEVHEVV